MSNMSNHHEFSTTTSGAAAVNPHTKSDEASLEFRDASENFPYTLKGEAAILDLLHITPWAKMSLGPAKNWSPILLNTIRLMLVSRFAMCCWWGPELRMVSTIRMRTLPIFHLKLNSSIQFLMAALQPEICRFIGQTTSKIIWRYSQVSGVLCVERKLIF